MNWLLVIVVAIILVNALIGMKVGLIKTIFSLCSMIVAILLTAWLSPYVNDFLKGNEKVYDGVSAKVDKLLASKEEPMEEEAEEEIKDKGEDTFIEGLALPKSIKDSLLKNKDAEVFKEQATNNIKEYVSDYLTGVVINALAFVITFVVILIILWVLCFALNIISKLPILNSINKTAGLAAGLVHGLIVVWLFFIVLTVFSSSELGQKAMEMISDNKLLSFIYDNNLLMKVVTNITKPFAK